MINSMVLDYGKCPCGGHYEKRYVEVRMTVDGKMLLLKDVPQGACPLCGSRVYKVEMLERIESMMKEEPFDRRLSQLTT